MIADPQQQLFLFSVKTGEPLPTDKKLCELTDELPPGDVVLLEKMESASLLPCTQWIDQVTHFSKSDFVCDRGTKRTDRIPPFCMQSRTLFCSENYRAAKQKKNCTTGGNTAALQR
jgi:hypothetical protein